MIRFFAVLVMAGLMIGMTVALHARLGRNGGRHSSPGHAAGDEGERDEQSYEPPPQGLHYQDVTILLRTGQLRRYHSRVVRRREVATELARRGIRAESALRAEDHAVFLDCMRRILTAAELVAITERLTLCRDPADDKFLELRSMAALI